MDNKLNFFRYHLIAMLLCIATFIMVGEGVFKSVGYLSLFLSFIIILTFLLGKVLTGKLLYDKVAIMLFAYLCICLLRLESISGVKFIVSIIFYLFVYLSGLQIRGRQLSKAIYFNSLIYIIIIMTYSVTVPSKSYSFIFNNPNALALLLFALSFFILHESENKLIKFFSIALILILILKTGSRAILVGYLVFIFIILVPSIFKIIKPRKLFLFIFTFSIFLCCSYALSKGTVVGDMLSNLSRLYFEKNLYSGRQDIWMTLYNSMSSIELFFGVGTGLYPSILLGGDLSAHNSFFQIIFQNGIIGLALVIGVLYFSIPKEIINRQAVIKSAFFISIVFPASFEVFIFQNHTVISTYLTIILFQMKCNTTDAKNYS